MPLEAFASKKDAVGTSGLFSTVFIFRITFSGRGIRLQGRRARELGIDLSCFNL